VFFEPNQSQFDLRFRLFGIGVRISPWFWIISAAMGWGGGPGRGDQFLQRLIIWIACVFVSILVHELGHVLVGRLFGSDGHIVLYGMGGLAIGSSALDRRWQRVAVYAAGPGAGFLLLALVWGGVVLAGVSVADIPPLARVAYRDLIWINLVWGLVNLLPVYPLDGGQISRDVCTGLWHDRGVRVSLGLSTLVAALIAVHALGVWLSEGYHERVRTLVKEWGSWLAFLLGLGDWYVALFFGMLALSSFATLQQLERQQREWDDHWDDR
jgi:Zn-dependent protease